MNSHVNPTPGSGRDRRALAEGRLADEFEGLHRWLVARARFRYRLSREDCEELAADTLLAWYHELCRAGGVHADAAYLDRVLRNRALDRKRTLSRAKRAAANTVYLASMDSCGVDLELDVLVAEREELRHRAELARDVLSRRELEVAVLSGQGVPRAQIAKRYGMSVRSVERYLQRAQRKLDDGLAVMSMRGRCALLALTIADIKTGRIRPGHPRYQRGNEHLNHCWRCRATTAVDGRQTA